MTQRNLQARDGGQARDLGVRDVQELFCRALHHRTAEHKAALKNAHLQADAAHGDAGAGAGVNGAGRLGDPVEPAIVPSSVFFLPGDPAGPYQYARWSNPTWSALEEALSILEDAETVIFPSGMAAVAAVLCTLPKPGDRILLPSDAYYTTRSLADTYLKPAGVGIVTCASADLDRQDFTGFRLVWIETPSNPGLDICDIRKAAAKGRQAGATVIVDNTTATPLGQRPIELGADAVVSSDTKTINGHSDVVFGHVASRDARLIAAVRDWRKLSGAIPGPFESWLVHRGLETLEVRFDRMCNNAETLAARLAEHRKLEQVKYPGLASHPAHVVAKSQMLRFAMILGVTLSDKVSAEKFINGCKFIRPTTSFGGVQTSAERRARWGDKVPEGFVRLSVGCEPIEELWKEMKAALDSL
jgi:cystathionine gamma-lyase